MNNRKNNRFLATYMKQKMQNKVEKVQLKELEDYFNQNGWILYDMDTMVHKFQQWRYQKDH
ncbi:MAG: hypothetical protein ACNS62_15155 [Candidatus Cyclobacteriaceae bacterium M3_2C_046]